jgi:hypothetical protein
MGDEVKISQPSLVKGAGVDQTVIKNNVQSGQFLTFTLPANKLSRIAGTEQFWWPRSTVQRRRTNPALNSLNAADSTAAMMALQNGSTRG